MQVQSLGQEDPLEKRMATHSSILAWRIPRTEEPDGLWSTGSKRVGHNWSDLAAAAAKSNHPVFWGCSLLLRYPYSICGVYFSLNKSTSYLSLCLSLNSFCDETSRTWASLRLKPGVWSQLEDCLAVWVQGPIWVAWFHFHMASQSCLLCFHLFAENPQIRAPT